MNERTRSGLAIIEVAVVIGVLGDVLLRVAPWGANVLLFNLAFAAGMIMVLRRFKPEYLTLSTLGLFAAQVFFALMFAWRDSVELRVADSFAIITILSVLILPRLNVTAQLAGVFHYVIGFLWASVNAAFAPGLLLAADIEWKSIPQKGVSKHLFSVLRGVAIATPILLIFGGLFVAADAVYQGWVERVFNIRPEIVFTHILLTGVFAWLSAGYLRGVIIAKAEHAAAVSLSVVPSDEPSFSKVADLRTEAVENPSALPNNRSAFEHLSISDPPSAPEPKADEPKAAESKAAEPKFEWARIENSILPPAFTLGTVEVAVILGLVNLLFLSFVIVQVPYLFGGMDLVQNTPDFKLANYARRGFGELVTVAGLVLPILLASHWLIKRESLFTERLFRVLAGIQIALLFVIMASAAQRLVLLTGNLGYGLTTIRLYPMIFMSWLAIVFVWFGITVLRGQRKHFAWGALWSAFFILAGTHVLNPDAFIVRTNIALMQQGREFDARYNSRLSDDALPALMASFDGLSHDDQKKVLLQSGERYCQLLQIGDLRSWNYSSWQARLALNSRDEAFAQFGRCDEGHFRYTRPDPIPER
jgi:hypothetical protein